MQTEDRDYSWPDYISLPLLFKVMVIITIKADNTFLILRAMHYLKDTVVLPKPDSSSCCSKAI